MDDCLVWSATSLDWYSLHGEGGDGSGLLMKDVLYRLISSTGIEGFSEQEAVGL